MTILLRVLQLTRSLSRTLLVKLVAVVSHDRVFILLAGYHVMYENWDVITTFDAGDIFVHLTATLLLADRTVEFETVRLATGQVSGSPAFGAAVNLVGAAALIFLYLRLARLGVHKANSNIDFLGGWGIPLLVYGLAVLAVSALLGEPRLPFMGVVTFVVNFDLVFDPEVVTSLWAENVTGEEVRAVPYVHERLPVWMEQPMDAASVNETAVNESLMEDAVTEITSE